MSKICHLFLIFGTENRPVMAVAKSCEDAKILGNINGLSNL